MLKLQLKKLPPVQYSAMIEVFQIVPQRLASMNNDQIEKLTINVGNQTAALGDWFSVSGDASDLHHHWTGDLSKVGGIGHGMSEGWIQIDSDVGNHLGSRMSGGTIHVAGSAKNFVGAEMTGGLVHIKGDAGSSAGAAYDGGRSGQNGGAILIEGSAANLVGKSMRRGLIAVGGDVKNCCGLSMKAGTIIVFGETRKNVGLEMTRGTIVLMKPPKQPSPFAAAGSHPMPVTRILNRYLSQLGFSKSIPDVNFQVLHGDPLRGSRGEILICNSAI